MTIKKQKTKKRHKLSTELWEDYNEMEKWGRSAQKRTSQPWKDMKGSQRDSKWLWSVRKRKWTNTKTLQSCKELGVEVGQLPHISTTKRHTMTLKRGKPSQRAPKTTTKEHRRTTKSHNMKRLQMTTQICKKKLLINEITLKIIRRPRQL